MRLAPGVLAALGAWLMIGLCFSIGFAASCAVDSLQLTGGELDPEGCGRSPFILRAYNAGGSTLWSWSPFGSERVLEHGLIDTGEGTYAFVLKDTNEIAIINCTGTQIGLIWMESFAYPREWTAICGSFSQESPQIRLWGAERVGTMNHVYCVEFDAIDLFDSIPQPDANLVWVTPLDGTDRFFDNAGLGPFTYDRDSGEIELTTGSRQDDWWICDVNLNLVRFRIDGATGEVLSPGWLQPLTLDPSDPTGHSVIARNVDGSVAWTRVFDQPALLALPPRSGRRPWSGAVLLDGDPMADVAPSVAVLDSQGTHSTIVTIDASPAGHSVLWHAPLEKSIPFGPSCSEATPEPDDPRATLFVLAGSPDEAGARGFYLDPEAGVLELQFALDFAFGAARVISDSRLLFVGESSSGLGAALSPEMYDCIPAPGGPTAVFDGHDVRRPIAAGFVALEAGPAAHLAVATDLTGKQVVLNASVFPTEAAILPSDQIRIQGTALSIDAGSPYPLSQVELSGTVHDLQYNHYSVDCLTVRDDGFVVQRVNRAGYLHAGDMWRLNTSQCDFQIDAFHEGSSSPVPLQSFTGTDFVLWAQPWTTANARTWVHGGSIDDDRWILPPALGWISKVFWGDTHEGFGALAVFAQSTLALAEGGPCALVPDAYYIWDGSDPRLPPAGTVTNAFEFASQGYPFLRVETMDGQSFGIDGAGPWDVPEIRAGWTGPLNSDESTSLEVYAERIPELRRIEFNLSFDPSLLYSFAIVPQCCDLVISEKTLSDGHIRFVIETRNESSLVAFRDGPLLEMTPLGVTDPPPGRSIMRWNPAPILYDRDGHSTEMRASTFAVDVPCPGKDVNRDGTFDRDDILHLLRDQVGLETLDAHARCVGDRNHDGEVALTDIVTLLHELEGESAPADVAARPATFSWRLESVTEDGRDFLVSLTTATGQKISALDVSIVAEGGDAAIEQVVLEPTILQAARNGNPAHLAAAVAGTITPRMSLRVRPVAPYLEPVRGLRMLAGEALDGRGLTMICDEQLLQFDVVSSSPLPTRTRLWQNHPNPFNPSTVIRLDLEHTQHVSVAIFDAAGRRVRELIHDFLPAGRHQLHWDGKDDQGKAAVSGIYFCRLGGTERESIVRMVLIR